jgi:carbon-monoxide dehydrogenase medium subunit
MKPAPFDYHLASSVADALDQLASADEDARVIAGGQSLVPMLALRLARPSLLVDISRLVELNGVTTTPDGTRIGATTRQAEILRDATIAKAVPALAQATRLVGHYHTRNRGTLGGSICLADPSAEYPAVAVALNAKIELKSKSGSRQVEARDFFEAPYVTKIQAGEIATSITFPAWGPNTVMLADEVMRRPGDFAMTGMILAIERDAGGKISRAGIAWFGMAQTPCAAKQAEKALLAQPAAKVDARAIAELALADTEPWDDIHASAEYRRTVGTTLATRMISAALAAGNR